MICLLLIMTTVFINGTESAQERVRHTETSLREEEINAKTKAWLLMVESGKVDEDELRRITPKSIFIAPLLTNGGGKCKEGYRHDHLGQCVKVIKMDPKVQLELLLQRLNKLYAEKASEREKEEEAEAEVEGGAEGGEGEGEEKEEGFQESSGPLQFSLPISGAEDKQNASQNGTQLGESTWGMNAPEGDRPLPEFIPVPLPFVLLNQTNQTKEIESSGGGPLNETEPFETSQFEGSGEVSSGDEPLGDETTTESPVTLLSEDYLDENETVTPPEEQTTTESPGEILTTTMAEDNTESYQNASENATDANPPEKPTPSRKESDRIVFPSDDVFRTPIVATAQSTRIRFPDELPNSHQPSPDYRFDKYQIHSSAIPQQQFWWLPKNWEIDRNQQKSALVKVWSRLPLIHDITYSQGTPEGFKPPFPSERPRQGELTPHEVFPISNLHHRSPDRTVRHFRTNRFVDNQRQFFRIHR